VTIYPVPGYYAGGNGGALGDPGGGRVLFMSPNPGPVNATIFDVHARRVIGLMGINADAPPGTACVNEDNGRFYVAAPFAAANPPDSQDYGFLVGEARATGNPYPQMKGSPDHWIGFSGPFYVAACDAVRHQLIVGRDGQLFVLQDQVPPYTPPPPPGDPDGVTTGGPYDPATSQLSYEGDGRAFGARLTLVGGYNAAAGDFFANGVQLPVVSSSSPVLTLGASGLPASPQGITLSDSQLTAAAQGASRDGGLQADLAAPAGAWSQVRHDYFDDQGPEPPAALKDPWAYPIIACATSQSEDPKADAATGSKVTCDAKNAQSAASAEASTPVEVPGVFRLVGAGSSVTSRE